MLQHVHTNSPVPPPGFHAADSAARPDASIAFRSAKNDVTLHADGRLELALMRFLEAEPSVQAFEPLPGGGLDVRYWGGRVLVAALPATGARRVDALALKRRHAGQGRRLVLVPERRLVAWPMRENCRIVADSGDAPIAPTERLILLEALDDAGGEICLGDLACLLPQRDDPVATILSLVPAGLLRVDLTRPVSAATRVSVFDPFRLPS